MKWPEIPLNPEARILRQFAAAWTILFLVFSLREAHSGRNHELVLTFAGISVFGIIGFFKPRMMRWIFVAASVITFPIGWIVTQVVLAFMFFVVLTPLGLMLRCFGRDELLRKPKPGQASFWKTRVESPSPEKYLKQY